MEDTVEQPKKRRGWPKGKPRGPRKAPVAAPMFVAAPEPEAPIHVIVNLRNGMTSEFGAGEHFVENGFHVFTYAASYDRYRTTRREFAISEIVEIEITEPRRDRPIEYGVNSQVHWLAQPDAATPPMPRPATTVTVTGPKIHSARQNANSVISALEQSSGPIKMDRMPNLSFGDSEA